MIAHARPAQLARFKHRSCTDLLMSLRVFRVILRAPQTLLFAPDFGHIFAVDYLTQWARSRLMRCSIFHRSLDRIVGMRQRCLRIAL